MKTRNHPVAAFFRVIGAGSQLIAGHLAYTKAHILAPLRMAAADLILLVAGFAALTTQVKDLIV